MTHGLKAWEGPKEKWPLSDARSRPRDTRGRASTDFFHDDELDADDVDVDVCKILVWGGLWECYVKKGVLRQFAIVCHPEGVLPKCKMRAWVALVCVTLTNSGWVGASSRQAAGYMHGQCSRQI